MKLQVCAEILGNFVLADDFIIKFGDYEFMVYLKNSNKFISITKRIKDYEKYIPQIEIRGNKINILKYTDEESYKDLLEWLQYIEAMGSYNCNISKIKYDAIEINWIYETEEERGTIPITSHKREKINKTPIVLSKKNLSNILVFNKYLSDTHIPFSYYRQGKNLFDEGHNYFAFINFFMMLEYCFADGKFHTKEVLKKFNDSKLLELCVLRVLSLANTSIPNSENIIWLKKECAKRNQSFDFQGIVYVLVQYRGILAHASRISKVYLFKDEDLRPITFFISSVCFMLCGYFQIFSTLTESHKKTYIENAIAEIKSNL